LSHTNPTKTTVGAPNVTLERTAILGTFPRGFRRRRDCQAGAVLLPTVQHSPGDNDRHYYEGAGLASQHAVLRLLCRCGAKKLVLDTANGEGRGPRFLIVCLPAQPSKLNRGARGKPAPAMASMDSRAIGRDDRNSCFAIGLEDCRRDDGSTTVEARLRIRRDRAFCPRLPTSGNGTALASDPAGQAADEGGLPLPTTGSGWPHA